MALTASVVRFPGIFMPTMRTMADRFGAFPSLGDWIDMKFDPADGAEREGAGAIYQREKVYGWIQGRGLEAISAFLRWNGLNPVYSSIAETLYERISRTCFSARDGSLRGGFVMNPWGEKLSESDSHTRSGTTLTALFLLRGLFAFVSLPESPYSADLSWIRPALRRAIDAALSGECWNDQLSFAGSTGGGHAGSDDTRKQGYEGRMIALGACKHLFEATRDPVDCNRGIQLINAVLDGYFFRNSRGEPWLSDLPVQKLGLDRDKDSLPPRVNPGHIIEFVGLALQFQRITVGVAGHRLHPLHELAHSAWKFGRAACGGIVRGMDGETGAFLDPNCPWWSSFEAVRTFTELYLGAENADERRLCVGRIEASLACIEEVYLAPSTTGIPVQTVSPEGRVVHFIPATPDIDPGYHTGIPLMDADLALKDLRTMQSGSAEAKIQPGLGTLLQGHLARSEPADSELDPLHVRACVIEAQGQAVVFISADVLEFSHRWAEAVSHNLSVLSGIPEDNIYLTATHTHTAPATIPLGSRSENPEFLELLEKAMSEAVLSALARIKPVVGWAGSILTDGFGINRRFRDPVSGAVSMRPNPAGDLDPEIGCLFLIDGHGQPASIMLNLAVHPTTLGVGIHAISADYPGRVVAALKRRYGNNTIVLPIQGACGDIRPVLLDSSGEAFAEGDAADIERMGQSAADAIIRGAHASRASNPFSWLDGVSLRSVSRIVQLPYAEVLTKEKIIRFRDQLAVAREGDQKQIGFTGTHDNPSLGTDALLAWADTMLETSFNAEGHYSGPLSEPARFSFCELGSSLGPSIQFFSLPGEAFSRIGVGLKASAQPSRLFVCGYCGGSVGYIPTKAAFSQGGYEVERAFMFYNRPAPLSESLEALIPILYNELRKEAI